MRFLLLLTLCLSAPLLAADCRLSMPRAGFADQISEREPVGDGSHAQGRLWFFSEIVDGKDEVLIHQWYRNGEEDVRVRLSVGADRWRTWSGRRAEPGARLTVRVTTESGCDLGEYGMTTSASPTPPADALTAAREALSQGDITGARLLARKAQEAGDRRPALSRFIEEELALAELARDIDNDNLYVAGGRLSSLKKRRLSAQQRTLLAAEEARWQERRDSLQRQLGLRLMALQRSLASQPAIQGCDSEISNTDWLPDPEREHLMITGQQVEGSTQTVELLDGRTGLSHRIERPCLSP
jgi:hypothetical protein